FIDPNQPDFTHCRVLPVGDLFPIHTRRGPYDATCLGVEDLCKRMHGQIFVREARQRGFSLLGVTTAECLAFIDESDALSAAYGQFLDGQPDFMETFQPADPLLDELFPEARRKNVAFMSDLAAAYRAPRSIGALGAMQLAREYADA
ncbi:MAG TPA: hypothetical protein VKQ34_01990, partial [Candidatus Saccharimonadales bacterium]|nr:hypothetical protein [Candidatus Saccharimonadales bacterium]